MRITFDWEDFRTTRDKTRERVVKMHYDTLKRVSDWQQQVDAVSTYLTDDYVIARLEAALDIVKRWE